MIIDNIEIINLLLNNFICLIFYFVLYAMLYKQSPSNFKSANSYLDIFYFTTTTQSTIGYGDITPASDIAKIIVCTHHVAIILIAIHFIINIKRKM